MAQFTLTDAEFERLLAASATDNERAALADMVRVANDIDQQLALANWRKNTLKFIQLMGRLDAAMGRLAGNAGILHSPDVKAVRNRLAAIRKELGLADEAADDDVENEAAEADDVATAAAGPMPVTATTSGRFEAFFAANLPNVTHFSASEFLYKGASHASNGLNVDPPKALWANVIPLARLLNQLRAGLGAPVRLTSIYRGPVYNTAIGGASTSQHMKFKAADFVGGSGTPSDWAQRLRDLRASGAFSGGIGTYGSFVHVDVRGTDADCTG